MGIRDFLNYLFDENPKYRNSNEANIQDLSIPMDRQLNLNPEGNELEWMDAVDLYEGEYANIRFKAGWKILKGWDFRRGVDRFLPVRWQIGDTIVEASYIKVDGLHIGVVQEMVIKS